MEEKGKGARSTAVSSREIFTRSSSSTSIRDAYSKLYPRPLVSSEKLVSDDQSSSLSNTDTIFADEKSHSSTTRRVQPFRFHRVKPTKEKPWLSRKGTRMERLQKAIPLIALALCVALIGIFIWLGYNQVEDLNYRLVLEDHFNTFDESVWHREVSVDGWGNNEFEWTTPYQNNSFVKDGRLHLLPRVGWSSLSNGTELNLTRMGLCEGGDYTCYASVSDVNDTFIPPIESARISTRLSKSIRYGRVEVRAKLPQGDWLWPAIWMMPAESVYGGWPASGEIDIAESRGNLPKSRRDTNKINAMGTTLHWGPNKNEDRYWMTFKDFILQHTTFADNFHTFGLEWTPDHITTYLDRRLLQVFYFTFPKQSMWNLGGFSLSETPTSGANMSWARGSKAAPFDQDFYLILNVAVGGTNYFFDDSMAGKPWANSMSRADAMRNFIENKDQWLPTWGDDYQRSMIVDSVKMWQLEL